MRKTIVYIITINCWTFKFVGDQSTASNEASRSVNSKSCKTKVTSEKAQVKSKKIKYSEKEIEIVYATFKTYMSNKDDTCKAPSHDDIQRMLSKHADIFHESRNAGSMKTWMYLKRQNK